VASAITHFIVGASLALPASRSRSIGAVVSPAALVFTAGFLAVAPDLDTALMRVFDIPHGSVFAHRGFFHSPFFLSVAALLLAAVAARRIRASILPVAAVWAVCAITHPLLDMLTDGGSGVMLLFPFSEARLHFQWRPIHVSPLGISGFFEGGRALRILRSEAPFDIAAMIIGLLGFSLRRRI